MTAIPRRSQNRRDEHGSEVYAAAVGEAIQAALNSGADKVAFGKDRRRLRDVGLSPSH